MATDEAKLKEYFKTKRVFDALEAENFRKLKRLRYLECDIDMLNKTCSQYENEIAKVYADTKRDVNALPDGMMFAEEYFKSVNDLLRGSGSRRAESALIKGKNAAYREIMQLEDEIESDRRRLDLLGSELLDIQRSIDD